MGRSIASLVTYTVLPRHELEVEVESSFSSIYTKGKIFILLSARRFTGTSGRAVVSCVSPSVVSDGTLFCHTPYLPRRCLPSPGIVLPTILL